MKLMIASDIHGSYYYCDKLVKAFNEEKADKLVLLGDILYHGPRNDLPCEYEPKKVINILNGIKDKILCVRGNCDTEVDQMVLEFPVMADYAVLNIDGTVMYLTHGHHYNPDNLLPMNNGEILLYGHTHIPKDEIVNGIRCINPGSVSIPKENSNNSYVIFENGKFEFKKL